MTQAILTKYLSPTNTRGARIKAQAYGGVVTINYPHELDTVAAHRSAAQALAAKLRFTGDVSEAYGAPDGKGYVFFVKGAK